MKQTKPKSKKNQASTQNNVIQLSFDKAQMVEMMQQQIRDHALSLSLEFVQALFTEEVERLCGVRYAHEERSHYRYGSQPGSVTLNGSKHRIRKPRVRTKDGKEVALENYKLLNSNEVLPTQCLERMVLGVSTRNYQQVTQAAIEGFGVSRGSVSSHFIKASKKLVNEFETRDLSQERYAVVMLDGQAYAGQMILAAIGITEAGVKKVLGIIQGASENTEVVKDFLADLRERGLSSEQNTLFVTDGSTALRKGIKAVWGDRAFIMRCTVHKKRNLRGYVTEQHWPQVEKMYDDALNASTFKEAHKRLCTLLRYLERISPSAYRSLKEAFADLLTVKALGAGELLEKTLSTTNPIESAFSRARDAARNVKRWRKGDMRYRWAAAGMMTAEKSFNRIRGYKEMGAFVERLDSAKVEIIDQKAQAA